MLGILGKHDIGCLTVWELLFSCLQQGFLEGWVDDVT